MTSSSITGRYRKAIAAASLVVGPLLMSVGDLLHPEERWDAAGQAAIIIEQSSRWYVAHLLLFIGLLLFIPGILALARLTSEQRPTAGYAVRVLPLRSEREHFALSSYARCSSGATSLMMQTCLQRPLCWTPSSRVGCWA